MKKYLTFVFAFLLLPNVVFAEIYKAIDSQGNVIYSDRPIPGSRPVDLPPSQTVTSSPPQAQNGGQSQEQLQVQVNNPFVYKEISIANLTDQQTFWNTPEIPVTVNIVPGLQQNDRVQLVLDGTVYGQPSDAPQFTLAQLPRGTHTLQAQVINPAGQVIAQSPTITIFIHQSALGGANNQNQTVPAQSVQSTGIQPVIHQPFQNLQNPPNQITPLNPPRPASNSNPTNSD